MAAQSKHNLTKHSIQVETIIYSLCILVTIRFLDDGTAVRSPCASSMLQRHMHTHAG